MPERPLVILDALLVRSRPTGVGRSILELTRALAGADRGIDFTILATDPGRFAFLGLPSGIYRLDGAGPTLLHGLGMALLLARIAHPLGLHHDNMRHPLRAVGAFGTLLVTLIAAGVAIWQFVSA